MGSSYIPRYQFQAIAERRSKPNKVELRRILKSGKPGAVRTYERHGGEKTPEDVIERLERLNPGTKWVIA